MRTLSRTLNELPREQIEGLTAYIVGFLTDDDYQERSAFQGISPRKSEIPAAIDEWLAVERELH